MPLSLSHLSVPHALTFTFSHGFTVSPTPFHIPNFPLLNALSCSPCCRSLSVSSTILFSPLCRFHAMFAPGYVENESESVLNTIIFSPIRILSVCVEVSVYLTKCHTTPVIISCGVSLSTVLCCLSSPVKRQVTCPSSSRTLRPLSMKSKCHRAR